MQLEDPNRLIEVPAQFLADCLDIFTISQEIIKGLLKTNLEPERHAIWVHQLSVIRLQYDRISETIETVPEVDSKSPAGSSRGLTIFIPKPGKSYFPIKPGSAIVGSPVANQERPTIRLDFEGNTLNTDYFRNFWFRLLHAADRLVQNYPTIARTWYQEGPEFPFLKVGIFHIEQARRAIRAQKHTNAQVIEDACEIYPEIREALERWIGQPSDAPR